MSQEVKQTDCACCGARCKDWRNTKVLSDVYSVCAECNDLIFLDRFGSYEGAHRHEDFWMDERTIQPVRDKIINQRQSYCYCCGKACDVGTKSTNVNCVAVCAECDDKASTFLSFTKTHHANIWDGKYHATTLNTVREQHIQAVKAAEKVPETKAPMNNYSVCDCCGVVTKDDRQDFQKLDDHYKVVCLDCSDKLSKKYNSPHWAKETVYYSSGSYSGEYLSFKRQIIAENTTKFANCYCCEGRVKDTRTDTYDATNCNLICSSCAEACAERNKTLSWANSHLWHKDHKVVDEYKKELQTKLISTAFTTVSQDTLSSPPEHPQSERHCHCCDALTTIPEHKTSLLENGRCVPICQGCDKAICREIDPEGDDFVPEDEGSVWDSVEFKQEIRVVKNKQRNKRRKHMPIDEDGNEVSFGELVKNDMVNAGYRVASTQITKGTKGAILMMLKDKGTEESKIRAFAEMMDGEVGDVLVAAFLGYSMTMIPGLKEDPRAQRLSEEFRINGMTTAGNFLADSVIKHLVPVINDSMKNLPPLGETLGVKKPARKRVVLNPANTTETTEDTTPEETPEASAPPVKRKVSTNTTSTDAT